MKLYEIDLRNKQLENIQEQLNDSSAVYFFYFNFFSYFTENIDDLYANIIYLIEKSFHEPKEKNFGDYYRIILTLTGQKLPDKKLEQLRAFLEDDGLRNFENTKHLFSILQEMQSPIYIGKASRLKTRISQHLKLSSDLCKRLALNDIDIFNCKLKFYYVNDNLPDNVNNLFEDIATRILKPGFVRRIG